jgi:hypothetical protein
MTMYLGRGEEGITAIKPKITFLSYEINVKIA